MEVKSTCGTPVLSVNAEFTAVVVLCLCSFDLGSELGIVLLLRVRLGVAAVLDAGAGAAVMLVDCDD